MGEAKFPIRESEKPVSAYDVLIVESVMTALRAGEELTEDRLFGIIEQCKTQI